MERGAPDSQSSNAGEEGRASSRLSYSVADVCFVVCVVIISSVVGVAFESALAAGLLAVFGGVAAWAIWKEFRHRARHSKEPER